MCKSVLYMANSVTQTVNPAATINFGSAIHKRGNDIISSGGSVTINEPGYFDIIANITFADTEAGVAQVTLNKDGTPIAGATAYQTTGTAQAEHSLCIPALVKVNCCKGTVITATVSGVTINVMSAAIEAKTV